MEHIITLRQATVITNIDLLYRGILCGYTSTNITTDKGEVTTTYEWAGGFRGHGQANSVQECVENIMRVIDKSKGDVPKDEY